MKDVVCWVCVCGGGGGSFSKQFSYTVSIHLERHDASPGLSEFPSQFPGTPSRLQSCKPTLHLREKKGREGGRRWERRREVVVGGWGGGRGDTHNVVNYSKFNSNFR